MSITAVVQNDTIKLPPGVHVADGTYVEIALPETPQPPVAAGHDDPFYRLAELAEPMGALTNEEIDAIIYGG